VELPNAEAAIISPEKLCEYLLSPSHPIGRYKAALFRLYGYDQDHWEALENDVRSILTNSADVLESTEYGTKYVVRGSITGPSGRTLAIVTVWIILINEDAPRFVTAYPED
jgi:Domain of unknown function (DUF6883)